MKKIFIFDLYEKLLNILEDLKDATNYSLSKLNYPTHSFEDIRLFVGNGVKKLIERAIPDGLNNKNFDECLETFKKNYKENMYNKTKVYDGVVEMLKSLKAKVVKTAIVSNKFDLAVKELSEKYFGDLIDIALGENEKEGIRTKPSPDTVLKVFTLMNLKADEAIYIGDSDVDIKTAENSSMPCISVTWGFRDKEFLIKNGAKIIVESPKEILNYIES